MKKMKRGVALLLSFFMVLSLAVPSALTIHAEEIVNVEINSEEELAIIPENTGTEAAVLTEPEGDFEEIQSISEVPETEEITVGIDGFLQMISEMPSVEEVNHMSQEEVNIVVDQYYALLDAYDALSEAEQNQFCEEYTELYVFVFEELGAALSETLNAGVEVMSLLPLEERHAYLVVGNHDDVDISAVPIELVLDNLWDSKGNHVELPEDAKVVWSYYKDKEDNVISDNYFLLEEGGTLDLSIFEEYDRYTMEMIVGDGNQLNPDNVRYIVTVYLSDTITGMRTYEWYTQDEDGTRHKVEPTDVRVTSTNQLGISAQSRSFFVPDHVEGREYYLGIKDPIDEHPFLQLDVVNYGEMLGVIAYQQLGFGEYPYTNLADQMVNLNMKKRDAGYKQTWDEPEVTEDSVDISTTYGFIYKNSFSGEILSMDLVTFAIRKDGVSFNDRASLNGKDVKLISTEHLSLDEIKVNPFDYTSDDFSYIKRVYLKEGYVADAEYNYALDAHSPIWGDANSHVVKAVKGSYHSLDEVSELEDISSQLLPVDASEKGYLANYDIAKGGQVFTIFFDDDTVFRFLVVFQEYDKNADVNYVREYSDVPIVGEADPWFRISGAADEAGNLLNTYVIENGKRNNMDTMYGYGYQAVFINDMVDKFVPTIWRVNDEAITIDNIYVNGKLYHEGDVLSFENGKNELEATFSVIITDKKGPHTKNYSVKFIKKATGPKLYVAGPLAPDVRSIFLDEYHENKHDIFLANVGDAPLTDLWLDLDATNVQLDEYWTIGGEGNNTLAACPDNFNKDLMETEYGELANVAKIRLVPPSARMTGEISGTLKIYSGKEGDADHSELLATIVLSDLANNPKITTDTLDDAVLYVPYSYLITTDNMYDWVDVTYEIVDGSLPSGVELIESTGEIYGVPLETGTFEVTVSTHFNSTSENYAFTPSTVTLTLTVLDNTNENVYNATDMAEGYQILDSIGTDEGGYDFVLYNIEDTIYRSNGEYGEFVDLWLNGEKLTRGVDYDADSGSTKITVYSQTFENKANKDGRNTIAAEFRTTDVSGKNTKEDTNQLNRTAQNFRINNSCSHSFDSGSITRSPSCINPGIRTYTCTKCGATTTETIAALGHILNSGVVTQEPTCTATGIRTYTCTRCGVNGTEVIPARGHSVQVTTTGASCLKNGLKESRCTVCGTVTKTEVIPATGHDYDAGVVTKKATCIDNGIKTFTCNRCKDSYIEVIRATGHKFNNGVVTKEAGCIEDGIKVFTCENCKENYSESLLATGHTYTSKIIKNPTLKEDGEKEFTCIKCGDSFTEIIPALMGEDHTHKYDNGVIVRKPTCTENGEKKFTCAECEESYTEVILATGHDFDDGFVKEEATCTENGSMVSVCVNCGEVHETTIVAVGHSYDGGSVKEEATCTENGSMEYVCANCDSSYEEEIPATGHEYDDGKVTKNPTYTETGIKTYTCQRCNSTMTEVIPVMVRPGTGTGTGTGNGIGSGNGSGASGNGIIILDDSEVNIVTCSIRMTSASGNSLGGMILELHSTPQSAVLGDDGFAQFNPIEFGEHTIILKDKNGTVLSEKHITVIPGESFSVNGDIVTVTRGSQCTLNVQYNDDGTMTLLSVWGTGGLQTGDTSRVALYLMLLILSIIALITVIVFDRRSRRVR